MYWEWDESNRKESPKFNGVEQTKKLHIRRIEMNKKKTTGSDSNRYDTRMILIPHVLKTCKNVHMHALNLMDVDI